MVNRFVRYELRTTDVDAARSFYSELLGVGLWRDSVDLGPLPARAAAHGAPPHWLGHIGVEDVVGAVHRFVGGGATPLGPVTQTRDGARQAIVRDPFGAVVALNESTGDDTADCISWHVLHARDEANAFSVYAGLFDWMPLETVDLGATGDRHQIFSWTASGRPVGSTSNVARLPHVHPQWLFFFRTEDLDRSLRLVREMGGLTLAIRQTGTGDLVAPCDDPQGAAFALWEPAKSAGPSSAPRS